MHYHTLKKLIGLFVTSLNCLNTCFMHSDLKADMGAKIEQKTSQASEHGAQPELLPEKAEVDRIESGNGLWLQNADIRKMEACLW